MQILHRGLPGAFLMLELHGDRALFGLGLAGALMAASWLVPAIG